jgi:hypothetical protein
MRRRWLTLLGAGVVAVSAAAVSSCEQGTTPGRDAPTAPSRLVSSTRELELIRERLELPDVLTLTHLIGAEGGTVRIAGHTLEVPRGAVASPTLFTLTVVASGHVEVEATALSSGLLGRIVNVGERGFQQPVKLHLTYARAINVPEDESRLTIVKKVGSYRNAANFIVIPSTVDAQRQLVTAELHGFSGYMMAAD